MKRILAVVACAALWTAQAHADILQMRSGEYKRGKILRETPDEVLFDSENDGAIVEVKKSEISIIDRETVTAGGTGGLNFVSVAPKKQKAKPAAKPSFFERISKPTDAKEEAGAAKMFAPEQQSAMLDKAEKMFQDLMAKNPQMRQWLDDIVKNLDIKSKELDKVVEAAKDASS